MKIVHIITRIGRGGAPMMLYKLLRKLRKKNEDEHIILGLRKDNKLEKELEEININVILLGLDKNLLSLQKLWRFRKVLQQIKPDVIHSWMYHSNVLASMFSPRESNIVWSTHHSLDDLKKEKYLTQSLIKVGPHLEKPIAKHIYCSMTSKQQHQDIGYSVDKSVVIPNGFDIQEFYADEKKGIRFREYYGIPLGATVFGQAARYHLLKNQEWLIKVFANVTKKNSNVFLLLAGDGVDENNDTLVGLIKKEGMRDKVKLIGECKDMPSFYNAIDFYCSSSLSEAFPMVLGEAMACKTPCIATDVGDSSFIIGDDGWIVKVGDAESYKDKMSEALRLDKSEYLQKGKSARNRIKKKFSLKAVSTRYKEIYNKALSN